MPIDFVGYFLTWGKQYHFLRYLRSTPPPFLRISSALQAVVAGDPTLSRFAWLVNSPFRFLNGRFNYVAVF